MESLVLLDSNTEKLLLYMNSLTEVMKEHYKEIYKILPRSPSPREGKSLSNDEATHAEVRMFFATKFKVNIYETQTPGTTLAPNSKNNRVRHG